MADGSLASGMRAVGLQSSEDRLLNYGRLAIAKKLPTIEERADAFWRYVKADEVALDALIRSGLRVGLWKPYEEKLKSEQEFGGAEGQNKSASLGEGHKSGAAAPPMPVTEFGEGGGQNVEASRGRLDIAPASPEPDARGAHADRDGGGQSWSASDEGHQCAAPSVSTPSAAGDQSSSALDEGQESAAPAADTSSPAGGPLTCAPDKGHNPTAPAGGPLKPIWPTIHSPPDGPRPSPVRYSTPPSLRPARPPAQRMPEAHERPASVQASIADTWRKKLDIEIQGRKIRDYLARDLLDTFDNTQGNWHRSIRADEDEIKSRQRSIAFRKHNEAFCRKLIELAGIKPNDRIGRVDIKDEHIEQAWEYAEELGRGKAA